ncbi:unnamed protein product [Urochloa humidicola]
MEKEFPVPPVVFTPSTPRHRRHLAPGAGASPPLELAPPRPSTSSAANPLLFMSFDISAAAASSSAPPLFAGPMGVGGTSRSLASTRARSGERRSPSSTRSARSTPRSTPRPEPVELHGH